MNLETRTPSQNGFALEECIHHSLQPFVTCLRENELRAHFNDPSLNGIDHWITSGNTHIFIQDKWKESTSQHEVAQFLICAERIQNRLKADAVHLIWAGKTYPTPFARTTLHEKNVRILCCDVSIYSLARLVVLEVCDMLDMDPTQCLQTIHNDKGKEKELKQDKVEHHEQNKEQTKDIIDEVFRTSFQKIRKALAVCGEQDIYSLYNSSIPERVNWASFKKIDFNAFLKHVRAFCWPTKHKRTHSKLLFFYCKMRYISLELAEFANKYASLRDKHFPIFKCYAEPMTEAEYLGAIGFCEDYTVTTLRLDGIFEKRVSGLENMFQENYHQF